MPQPGAAIDVLGHSRTSGVPQVIGVIQRHEFWRVLDSQVAPRGDYVSRRLDKIADRVRGHVVPLDILAGAEVLGVIQAERVLSAFHGRKIDVPGEIVKVIGKGSAAILAVVMRVKAYRGLLQGSLEVKTGGVLIHMRDRDVNGNWPFAVAESAAEPAAIHRHPIEEIIFLIGMALRSVKRGR